MEMIESTILTYLNNCLSPLQAYAEEPENPPKDFLVIEKTSGGSENHLKVASFTVKSYSTTLEKAAQLNDKVIDLMEKLPVLPQISACMVNSDYNYTDTAEKRYRYQALLDVFYY